MAESNSEMCQRLAREVDKDELIRKLLICIGRMRRPRDRAMPLWSFVSSATSNGSGISAAICSVYGVNPDSGEATRAGEELSK